jgi:zinc transport system substrate-binding protein
MILTSVRIIVMRRPLLILSAVATVSLVLSGCASTAFGDEGNKAGVQVLASFYPLQYVAQQVGGKLVDVSSLTPPGAEPHDVELSPREVRTVSEADVVVYLSGFQAAVDEGVAARQPTNVVNAAHTADLVAWAHPKRGEGTLDPHFWLDPHRLERLAGPVAAALTKADPSHADTYAANAKRLEMSLTDLDTKYRTGLASCKDRTIVTSHEAFGYLSDRYDLSQVGMSGLDPDAEPSPARLRQIRDLVRKKGVTTIFSEHLVSPKVAQTLAADLGVKSAVLDPVESLTDPRSNYRDVMLKNLSVLRTALDCK